MEQHGEDGREMYWEVKIECAHKNKHSPTHLLMHTQEVVSLGSVLQRGTGQSDPFVSRQSIMGFLFLVRNQYNLTVVL